MNQSDIFKKSLLGTTGSALLPGSSSLYTLAKGLSNSGRQTPQTTLTPNTQTSFDQTGLQGGFFGSSGPLKPATPDSSLGGNPAATTPTTPKSQFINSLGSGSTALGGASTASATPTPTQADPNKGYSDAFQKYIDSLSPSAREKDVQGRLDNVLSRTAAGVSRQEESRIPMEFITGRQQSIEKRGLAAADPLQRELARLSGDRTLTSGAYKDRADFEKNLRDFGVDQSQYADTRADATAKANAPISLSEGETLYDPKTGQALYKNPKTYAPTSGSGSQSGLLSAVMANPGLFATLTPTIKSQLIPQLAEAGFDTTRLNVLGLPASQQEDLTTFGTVQNYISDLLAKGESLEGVGGLGSGSISNAAFKNLGIGSAEGQQNRNLIGQIQGAIAKLRGGTSFTPNEQTLLDTYTPTINDSDAQIRQKLTDLNTFINNKKANLVGLQAGIVPGGGTSGSLSNSPAPLGGSANDPLGLGI